MEEAVARPRLAIIGGGGAMGRLFARLLCGSVSELYLFDFFGSGGRHASLSQAFQEIQTGAALRDLAGSVAAVIPSDADSREAGGAGAFTVSDDLRADRGISRLAPIRDRSNCRPVWPDSALPLGDIIARAGSLGAGCTVYAGPPSDATALLPNAEVVLLALGFENREAYAQTVRYYAPWLRSDALVVDLGSTKSQPLDVLSRELPASVGLLGAHPLFGPIVTDLTGLIVAAVDSERGRAISVWRDWFLEQLAAWRMIVVPASALEHDDAMGFVQALTHFALLTFAYTFVRLDRDPASLLTLRTPVFEPLLYLAARVAYLAGANPDTYRSIQTFSTRPDARRAFVDAAQELLAAIEGASEHRLAGNAPDPIATLFRRYGEPWSPEGRDRRERQRREHLLEMGVRLVDNLNNLRQEVVGAVGQVRAVEERRAGQPPRVVVGVVDVDLRDPGKYDLASQIRLRRLNLALGSTHGTAQRGSPVDDAGPDLLVPLARARILTDPELLIWLFETNQLIESRSFSLMVPEWFDDDVLVRLLRKPPNRQLPGQSQIWDVSARAIDDRQRAPGGARSVLLTLRVVVHPAEIFAARQAILRDGEAAYLTALADIEARLADVRRTEERATLKEPRRRSAGEEDRLKHERKALVDRRTAEVDREVRRRTRTRVQLLTDEAIDWLLQRGCTRGHPGARMSEVEAGLSSD